MIRLWTDRGLRAQAAGAALAGAAGLAMLLALARFLGPDDYALYGLVAAIASLALVVQDGGHRVRLMRDLTAGAHPSADRDTAVGSAIGWSLTATGAAVVAALAIGPLWGWPPTVALILLIAGNFGKASNGFTSSVLRARGAFETEGLLQFQRQALVLCVAIAAVAIWPDVTVVCLAVCLAQLATLLLQVERRELAPLRSGRPEIWLMSIAVLTVAYMRVDLLVLGHVAGATAEVGSYAAMTRLTDMYVFALTPLATVFFHWIRQDPDRFSRMEIARLCGLLAVPGCVLLVVALTAGEPLVTLALGKEFAAGARTLPLLAAAMIVLPSNFLLSQMLIAADQEKVLVAITASALALKLAVSWMWAPAFGAVACAFTVLLAEIFLLASCLAALRLSAVKTVP